MSEQPALPRTVSLGRLRVHIVSDGEFRLDGGSMFGVVPKTLWERVCPADERNRIRMATNCLLIEANRELVLVDSGIGTKLTSKECSIYGVDPQRKNLLDSMAALGFHPEDVTAVATSHLHFDHCGWLTRPTSGGSLVPTFPKAKYFLESGELAHAREPNERDRASYWSRNWEPLFERGQVELFEERITVASGVELLKAPGHNRDMCVVTLDGGKGMRGIFLADLVPLAAHVPLPWIMAYDLYPLTTLEQKKRWLPRLARERWVCFFEHDPLVPLGWIEEEAEGKFRAHAGLPRFEAQEVVEVAREGRVS
jgi:glyoxylase-like metal-dependent hydrolase (beta-lactamase superfamily II)